MKKKMIPVIVAVVLILVIGALGLGTILLDKYSYSKDRADLSQYLNIEKSDEAAIVLQNEVIVEKAKIRDNVYYFDIQTVQAYLNARFYADKNENLLLYTTPTEVIRTEIGSKDYQGSAGENVGSEAYEIAFYDGDTLFIAADYVAKFTNYSYSSFTEPNRMQVYTEWGMQSQAVIEKDTWLREKGGVKSNILRDLGAAEQVTVLEEMEKWSKVKTGDALIGYVENKRLSGRTDRKQVPVTNYVEPEYTSIKKDYKINLAFHQVTTADANNYLEDALANTKAVNTISPTWFYLNDNEGGFISLASREYVEKAHARGIEVWALLENITYKSEIDIYEILSRTSKRSYLIQNLISTVLEFGIDGINLDIESVPDKAGEHYIQFIRELSIACRANGIILSVDNYVPREYSAHYNRKEQGIVADYLIIMGYDEHWHNSGDPGSVASIGFVEDGIKKTLDEVPAEKVINAVPFYTNFWKTTGGETTDSQVGMTAAETFLKEKGAEAVWDEETCQNYAEFQDGDAFYQVWLEDEKSLEAKLSVMKTNGLAGVACWKLGLEKPQVWDVISNYVQGN